MGGEFDYRTLKVKEKKEAQKYNLYFYLYLMDFPRLAR